MKVDLKEGQAILLPKERASFDPAKIPSAVKDAGFTPGEIEVTAAGTLAREGELLLLEMPGPVPKLVLAGGPKGPELEGRSDLLGQKLRVTGKLHPSHADRAPGITVERWSLLAD